LSIVAHAPFPKGAVKLCLMKLLIVEDNREMRRLMCQIVRRQIEEIFECENGAQALPLYREHLPDWVLMDVEMPEIDGISATKQIIAAFPHARIVIVTDYNNQNVRRAAADAGACEFVAKENLIELRRLLAH
jgi:two-component system response regulator DegU